MDDVKYFKERKRMTEDCKYCVDCPLNLSNNGKRLSCGKFENNYPEKAIAIVEEWAKEHPVGTYESVFLEKFPNARMADVINICVETIFGNSVPECGDINCEDCWNREVEDE